MSDYPTCEERIDEQLGREIERIREVTQTRYMCPDCEHTYDDDYGCPECGSELEEFDPVDAHNRYMEGVLEITPLHIVYRVGLSWGGPADGFYLYVDPEDRTIDKIEYYFQDWFDGATRVLTGDEFDLVRDMFESYIEIAEHERTHK